MNVNICPRCGRPRSGSGCSGPTCSCTTVLPSSNFPVNSSCGSGCGNSCSNGCGCQQRRKLLHTRTNRTDRADWPCRRPNWTDRTYWSYRADWSNRLAWH